VVQQSPKSLEFAVTINPEGCFMITASFGELIFEQVDGYRISVGFDPSQGIKDRFHVYIVDRISAHEQPPTPIKLPSDGKVIRGTLQISGGDRSYEFEGIDLVGANVGADRNERYRVVEFQYTEKQINASTSPVKKLENNNPVADDRGNLPAEYSYSVEDENEYLLGFESHIALSRASVLQFSTLRNSANSFIKKIIQVNQNRVANKKMAKFVIGFGFASEGIEINKDNLRHCFVTESFGECLDWPNFPLAQYTEQGSLPRVGTNFPASNEMELLNRKDGHTEGFMSPGHPETVEVATFVVRGYRDLPVV
jgi:hypothetical protein